MRTVISASIVEIEMSAVDAEAAVDTARSVVAVAMTVEAIVRIAIVVVEIEEELLATRLTASTSRTATPSILILWARRRLHSNSKFICSSRVRKVAETTRKKAREARQRFVN